jgi:hypothetical protein
LKEGRSFWTFAVTGRKREGEKESRLKRKREK